MRSRRSIEPGDDGPPDMTDATGRLSVGGRRIEPEDPESAAARRRREMFDDLALAGASFVMAVVAVGVVAIVQRWADSSTTGRIAIAAALVVTAAPVLVVRRRDRRPLVAVALRRTWHDLAVGIGLGWRRRARLAATIGLEIVWVGVATTLLP